METKDKFKKVRLSSRQLSLRQIANEYHFSIYILGFAFKHEKQLFQFQDKNEILFQNKIELRNRLEKESEYSACFKILSMIEAKLRVDFIIRVRNGYRDNISNAFWILTDVQYPGNQIYEYRLKDIISIWKKEKPEVNEILVKVEKAISEFRHWIAHGRYWIPIKWKVSDYNFQTVYLLGLQFENSLGRILYK